MKIGIEAIAQMSRTERLTRECLALLADSVVGAPSDRDDLGLWIALSAERAASLSSGERAIWDFALTFWIASTCDLYTLRDRLDGPSRAAIAAIITDWLTA